MKPLCLPWFYAVFMIGLAGCGSVAETPHAPSADVPKLAAFRDAELVADRAPGRAALVGSGESMAPVMGENSMLVIAPIAFEDLQAGMMVAYVAGDGARVVHTLIAREGDGWEVKGINNQRIDRELVTRANLLGVVYATFNYDDDAPLTVPAPPSAPAPSGK